jgi:hypothetical protein
MLIKEHNLGSRPGSKSTIVCRKETLALVSKTTAAKPEKQLFFS